MSEVAEISKDIYEKLQNQIKNMLKIRILDYLNLGLDDHSLMNI